MRILTIKILCLVGLMGFLVGCKQAPLQPPEGHNALLVGQIIYQAHGITGKTAFMNGNKSSGIKVLYRIDEGPIKTTTTGKEGLFYLLGRANQEVEIVKLQVIKKHSNLQQTYSYTVNRKATLLAAKVINIGTFNWTIENSNWDFEEQRDRNMMLRQLYLSNFENDPWGEATWLTN